MNQHQATLLVLLVAYLARIKILMFYVFSATEAETLQNGVARIPSGVVLVLLSKNKILMSYVFSATEAETLRNGVARFPLEQ